MPALSDTPTLADAVAAVKAYAATLAARPDVELITCEIGEPAPPELLAQFRKGPTRLPPQLLDLYELMNGVRILWRFPGQWETGHLWIWPLTTDTEMEDTDGETTFFGPGSLTLFFDQQQSEYGTWLVAYGPDGPNPQELDYYDRNPDEDSDEYEAYVDSLDTSNADLVNARLVYAIHTDADPGEVLPYTIAEYLLQAVAHGFVKNWPRMTGYDEPDEDLARLLAPPVVPGTVAVGSRVDFYPAYESRSRGEVLQASPAAVPGLFLLRFDNGQTLWARHNQVLALPATPDLYEQVHADPWLLARTGRTAGWEAALRQMALLWGPFNNTRSSGRIDFSEVVLALLHPLPLPELLALTQELVAGLATLGNLDEPLVLTDAERELVFNPKEWKRLGWQRPSWGLPLILLSGLLMRLMQEPPAARAALAPANLDRLQTSYLLATYRGGNWGDIATELFDGMRTLLAGGTVMGTDAPDGPWPLTPPEITSRDADPALPGSYRIAYSY